MEKVVDTSYRAGQVINGIITKVGIKFGKGLFYIIVIPIISILFFVLGALTFKKKES
jgi:hypothetical protein